MVADAPRLWIPWAMPVPDVLNARTLSAIPGEALGLSFLDANNQLLSMPEILEQLRGKFGETMDAAEKMELQKAFGDTESILTSSVFSSIQEATLVSTRSPFPMRSLTVGANPVTWIVIGIVALVAALVLLYNKCEWFRNGVRG